MKLTAVKGKNFRNYIQISETTIEDNRVYFPILEKIVSRSEYRPFLKSFNKTVSQNYFINSTFIPAQFIQDIQKHFFPVYPQKDMRVINKEILFNQDIDKEKFLDFAHTVKLPKKYDIFNEKYSYQIESVYRAILFKTARIEVGTGGGKTLITYLYCRYLIENFVQNNKKILVIVPRKDLVLQTYKAFKEFNEFNESDIWVETMYSGSMKVIDAHIVIGTWQSLKEYDESYFDEFSVMICDEAHSAKAYSIRVDIYNKCKNVEYVFGMTGTYPEYNTIAYLDIVAMFGPLVYSKKTKELIEDGNVCPVFINKIRINYSGEEKDFAKNLKASGYIGSEKYRIEKTFFQNYTERTDVIVKLVKNLANNHLILVETVEYVKFLKDYIQERCPEKYVDIIYGDTKSDIRETIKNDMADRHNMILIATYETMSTGVSINNIMHVHFPDGGRSEIRIKQSIGRGLRLHPLKEYLNVFDYQDNMVSSSFLNHAKDRNDIYEREGHPGKYVDVEI